MSCRGAPVKQNHFVWQLFVLSCIGAPHHHHHHRFNYFMLYKHTNYFLKNVYVCVWECASCAFSHSLLMLNQLQVVTDTWAGDLQTHHLFCVCNFWGFMKMKSEENKVNIWIGLVCLICVYHFVPWKQLLSSSAFILKQILWVQLGSFLNLLVFCP